MSERMTRLKAPDGVESVDYGGERWPVKNGYVVLPVGAEVALTRTAIGFKLPHDPVVNYRRPNDLPTLTLPKKKYGG
jgi:hypothetical protein